MTVEQRNVVIRRYLFLKRVLCERDLDVVRRRYFMGQLKELRVNHPDVVRK